MAIPNLLKLMIHGFHLFGRGKKRLFHKLQASSFRCNKD